MTSPIEGSALHVRPEQEREFERIHALVRSAFQSARHAEGDEHDFVARQRAGSAYLPELALVLLRDDRLIGHLMLTQTAISTAGGEVPILLLACVVVAAEYRNCGLGTAFIEAGLRKAQTLGHTAVILLGDPAFYRRLGFVPSETFGISNGNGIAPGYVQVRKLVPGALAGASGLIVLPS